MEFFRFFERLLPHNLIENMAADTDNNNITREPSMNQCLSDFDKNTSILETEGNVTVNSSEYFSTNIESSVDNIDEFSAIKTFHYLENVIPIEITTNDNTYEEPMENEISLIEDIISNNATGENFIINDIENLIDRHVINKSNTSNDLEEIQIRDDTEVSNDIRNTEANTIYNYVCNDETMQSLDLVNNFFENNANATCEEKEFTELNSEIISNLKENIDIITIDSSTEDEMSQTFEIKDTVSINESDETESDGYNSSDFEFISESEAKIAGIVINHGIEKHEKLSQTGSEPIIFCFNEENHQGKEESDPGEGTSRQNRPRNEFEDRSYRNNHHIPIGDDYLGLFQGIYNPLMPMPDILFLENKSTRASAMNIQYDGIGFDKQLAMRRHQPDSSEDEFEDEANESAKKILKMYPGENRKRRRRYL